MDDEGIEDIDGDSIDESSVPVPEQFEWGETLDELKERLLAENRMVDWELDCDRLKEDGSVTPELVPWVASVPYAPPRTRARLLVRQYMRLGLTPPERIRVRKPYRRRVKPAHHRKCDERQIILWVADALYDPANVDESTAPAPAALALLRAIRTNRSMEQTFWQAMYVRILPTRSQIDQQTKFRDDGRQQLDLLSRFLDSCAGGVQ